MNYLGSDSFYFSSVSYELSNQNLVGYSHNISASISPVYLVGRLLL